MIQEVKEKILLGMSGGTDSSVAAMLLQEAGYEVVGVTFRFYEKDNDQTHLNDARALAQRLGIEHITYDARDIFQHKIIDYFIDEYMHGRTPVPCTLCNNYLKWPLLARLADERGIHHIATGHYVQKVNRDGHFYIAPAVDEDKDQSFFLWGLTQAILQRMVLPLGGWTKLQARAYAAERGFERVATKRDSLGVCFCPMDYRSFLKESPLYLNVKEELKGGEFVDEGGSFIAHHEGYPFYTIGQRRGLGIDLNRAVFVKEIDVKQNRVVLSDLKALEKNEIWLKDWNAVDAERLLAYDEVVVKIRYRKQYNTAKVHRVGEKLHVVLNQPLAAIANGQAAAFYKDDLLIGGGIIVDSQ